METTDNIIFDEIDIKKPKTDLEDDFVWTSDC